MTTLIACLWPYIVLGEADMSELTSTSQTKYPTSKVTEGEDSTETRAKHNKRRAIANKKWKLAYPKTAWATSVADVRRRSARKKGIVFSISTAYITSLIPDTCPIFGTPFKFAGNRVSTAESPSIDRLRAELGYIEGNIAIISVRANRVKSNCSSEEVLKVAKWMKKQGL